MEFPIMDWLNLALRWFHVIAGIAWIGSSFFFMWLDASLRPEARMPDGVKGATWMVHGGGFYHAQKYGVAPASLPAELHWFKLEAYFTWLTGFALLAVIYYVGADAYLIDPSVMALSRDQAILMSMGSFAGGWVFYDHICRSAVGRETRPLAIALFVLIMLSAWGYSEVFSARAAYLHVGAFVGTLMVGNVFFIIIPNQRKTVDAMTRGEAPDPAFGEQAKQRSVHNNYLTLPVILMMVSAHYPMLYGHDHGWLFIAFILVIGGLVRHFFNNKNAGLSGLKIAWSIPLALVVFAGLMVAVSWRGQDEAADGEPVALEDALAVVQIRCASCHAAMPSDADFEEAPGGVILETTEQLNALASRILAQVVLSRNMPLANKTEMTDEERQLLGRWIRQR